MKYLYLPIGLKPIEEDVNTQIEKIWGRGYCEIVWTGEIKPELKAVYKNGKFTLKAVTR